MADTRDFGRLFFHVVDLQPGPFLHTAPTQEIEEPFRSSTSLIVRFWPGKGLVIGWWRDSGMDEEEALLAALDGWGVDLYDADLEDEETRQTIRENIASKVDTLDEEWLIIDALGVSE